MQQLQTDEVNKGGRPIIELTEKDWNTVEKLCSLHCTGEEIAGILDVDYDTLNTRIKEKYGYGFSDYFKKKSAKGSASLRRRQYELAMDGNPTMLVWLGKQYLGQVDKQAVDNTSSDGSMSPPQPLTPESAKAISKDLDDEY